MGQGLFRVVFSELQKGGSCGSSGRALLLVSCSRRRSGEPRVRRGLGREDRRWASCFVRRRPADGGTGQLVDDVLATQSPLEDASPQREKLAVGRVAVGVLLVAAGRQRFHDGQLMAELVRRLKRAISVAL